MIVENFCVTEHTSFTIECIGEKEEWVYDIEVEDTHNFFANDILVHNSNYLSLDLVVKKLFDGLDEKEVTKKLDEFCTNVLEEVISQAFEEFRAATNCKQQKLHMKRECIANPGIWTAKKRYILNVWSKENVFYDTPELKIQGIEVVKSSTPRAAKKYMKEAIKLIVAGDEKKFQEFIEAKRNDFRTLPFEEIASPRGVTDIDKWYSPSTMFKPRTPIHVRGSIVYNKLITEVENHGDALQPIVNGDKIKFSYLICPNPVLQNVISVPGDLPSVLGLDDYLDKDEQFSKTVLSPVKKITDVIGWHLEPVASIEDLFCYD